ncbi:hypothetical protein HPB49_001377 [Dermacentor silvarum]|uniref:Uncharacterized protein n=1 Tax=Dermacentor silvarum TaxID=543639 RepID=A0ACB8DIG1_DERSI|nr:hypothetical protein HPB49_001377 [Dermacentor silvarum]
MTMTIRGCLWLGFCSTTQRLRLSQPLDFCTERSKTSTASAAVPTEMSSRPIGQRPRPQLIRERVAAAVAVPEELRHWAEDLPWRRAMHAAIAAAVIVGVCVAALIMAQTPEVEQPICDEDCMLYTKLLNETMDWSVDPCQDFYRFVCGRFKNKLSVRHQISYRFVQAIADLARQVDVPAEGQTAAQKAARLFKTCNDIATQDTDYVPRIRGYMRDANLHWPQHPETRDIESVDVVTRPTGGIDEFQHHVLNLGLGSPAHRTYFETLYAHYGVGVVEGVTFEEMLHYEDQIMAPLLRAYYAPPRRYVFERNHSDTSGTWERWTSVIEEFYHLSGNERIEISTTHQDYFKVFVELITTKETIVELVLGWIAVQYTSPFANRQLIANYHNTLQHAEVYHRSSCFILTSYLMGIALFLPFLQRVYTEPVRTDVHHIAREVRRTVYQTLELGTYPWAELDVVFKYMEIARVDDIEARFGAAFMHALIHYSDSEIKAF